MPDREEMNKKEDKPKFVRIPDELITDKDLTPTERLAFGVIHMHCKDRDSMNPVCSDQSICWLAKDLGVGERQMLRITKKLEEKGYLSKKWRHW